MPQFLRTFIVGCILFGVTFAMISTVAVAKTLHHRHHHAAVSHHASRTSSQLRSAQTHLAHLGYYTGKVDGKNGPKTITALKHFQRDHHLPVSGTLTKKTYAALVEADRRAPVAGMGGSYDRAPPQPNYFETHPDYYGQTNQEFSNPLLLGQPQAIQNRYGKLELTKTGQDSYVLNYNGQSVLNVTDQPSVIGVSSTYNLGTEDAIIVSTYRSQSATCAYQTYLLALRTDGPHTQEIGNCTRGYQAKAVEDSLWITFPEDDDARLVGATYRYEDGDLEKL